MLQNLPECFRKGPPKGTPKPGRTTGSQTLQGLPGTPGAPASSRRRDGLWGSSSLQGRGLPRGRRIRTHGLRKAKGSCRIDPRKGPRKDPAKIRFRKNDRGERTGQDGMFGSVASLPDDNPARRPVKRPWTQICAFQAQACDMADRDSRTLHQETTQKASRWIKRGQKGDKRKTDEAEGKGASWLFPKAALVPSLCACPLRPVAPGMGLKREPTSGCANARGSFSRPFPNAAPPAPRACGQARGQATGQTRGQSHDQAQN